MVLLLARQSSLQDHLSLVERGLDLDRVERKQIKMGMFGNYKFYCKSLHLLIQLLDERAKEILGFLSHVDVQSWQDANIRLRQPGTGIWFTDGPYFRNWLAEDNSKLWVYGIRESGGPQLGSSFTDKIRGSWSWKDNFDVSASI